MNTLKQLRDLISIKSIYPQEAKASRLLKGKLEQFGFQTKIQHVEIDRFNVLAEKGEGKALLIYGHLDTVALTSGWNTNPYTLTQKGDKLYGLGAWDMKGGLTTILSAIEGFEPKGFKLKLAFVVDEENISLGMHTLIQSGWLKDVVGAISPEPGFDYGLKGIAMGRIGRSVYKVTVKTQGGHVYMVGKRASAIEEACKILVAIKKMKQMKHKDLGESVIFPRFIKGGANAMSIPSHVEFELETQQVPPQTTEIVLQELQNIIAKLKLNVEVTITPVERSTPFCQPFVIDKKDYFVQQVSQVLQKTIGEKPTYYYRRSVADENRIAALGIPVLTIGPKGGNAHEPNEWVSKKSLIQLTQFFRNLLTSYSSKNLFLLRDSETSSE